MYCCRRGGAVNVVSYPPNVWIQQCTFDNNTSSGNGGAVWIDSHQTINNTSKGGNVTITNCTFLNNRAEGSSASTGGAIFYSGSEGANSELLYITNSTFVGNNASSGGAVCPWAVRNVNITQSSFEQNTAFSGRGGGTVHLW